GKLVERLRRNLEAQPRLADAAWAGQRQQALALQQLFGLQDRVGAADEAGQLGGQVVGRPVERAQGRELIRHAGHDQLEEAFSPCQVAPAGQECWAKERCALAAAWQASIALANTQKNESPSVRSSRPSLLRNASRSIW